MKYFIIALALTMLSGCAMLMSKEYIVVRHRGSVEEGVTVQVVIKDNFDLTGYSLWRKSPATNMNEWVPTNELETYQKMDRV